MTAVNAPADRFAGDLLELPAVFARLAGPVLVVAAVIGVFVRALPVLGSDFPVNDGGLFAAMSADLRANGLALPAYTSYNGGGIPFGYPPLGLYLNALAGPLVGGDAVSLRVVPLLFACLTIPAFWFMVRSWVAEPAAAMATLGWAIIPRAWMWQIDGGGITRAPGMLFAFLAIGATLRLMRAGSLRWWVVAPLMAGLTALSHLEAAAFVGITLLLDWLIRDRSRRGIGILVAVGVLAAVVASPWLIAVVAQHGLAPLTAAGQSRAAFMNIALAILVSLRWTAEPFVEVGAVLGIIGLGAAVAHGAWWLPLWIVAIFAALPGGAATYSVVPWVLLITVAVGQLVRIATSRRSLVIGGLVAILAVAASLWAPYAYTSPLRSVSTAQREAMAWIERETPRTARFLVVTGAYWPLDGIAEWFPTITGRVSANTVQGMEFTSPASWERAVQASMEIDECIVSNARCLVSWGQRWAVDFDYVFVPKGRAPGVEADECCVPLSEALDDDSRFTRVASLPGGSVFKRVK